MKPYAFTEAELALILRALTIPTCWQPRLRDEAAALVERALRGEQSLFSEAAS